MVTETLIALNAVAQFMPWDALVAAGIISPALAGVKKWLKVQSSTVMFLLVAGTSLATVVAHYLLTVPTNDPSVIAMQTAVLAFMTQPVYYFVFKPAVAFWRAEVEKAAALNAELKSAAVDTNPVLAQ